jgi:hypothetical protein
VSPSISIAKPSISRESTPFAIARFTSSKRNIFFAMLVATGIPRS